jgi:hypothetical protein
MGGAVFMLNQINAAFFADLELRFPSLFSVWGSLFVDRLNASENFLSKNGTSFAYQAGIKAGVRWLPFAFFTLHYTKVEPYCYTNAFNSVDKNKFPAAGMYVSGGESLGYYLPPNSDELLVRLESRFSPALKAYFQFQMLRHGADYGDNAVAGSSLNDRLTDLDSPKNFLTDGVYKRDNVFKLGGEYSFTKSPIPVLIFAETGLIDTRFTVNGKAGSGTSADYEDISNDVYRSGISFIFSIGFRLFF